MKNNTKVTAILLALSTGCLPPKTVATSDTSGNLLVGGLPTIRMAERIGKTSLNETVLLPYPASRNHVKNKTGKCRIVQGTTLVLAKKITLEKYGYYYVRVSSFANNVNPVLDPNPPVAQIKQSNEPNGWVDTSPAAQNLSKNDLEMAQIIQNSVTEEQTPEETGTVAPTATVVSTTTSVTTSSSSTTGENAECKDTNIREGYIYSKHFNVVGALEKNLDISGSSYNTSLGQKLVDKINTIGRALANPNRPNCYNVVGIALETLYLVSPAEFSIIGRPSAWMFNNFDKLPRVKAGKTKIKRAAGLDLKNAPKGTIVVYQPYSCSEQGITNTPHGHIEIVTVPGKKAMSFFERDISVPCRVKPDLFIPAQ